MMNRYKISFRNSEYGPVIVEASYYIVKEGLVIFRHKLETNSSSTMAGAYNIAEVFSITIEEE